MIRKLFILFAFCLTTSLFSAQGDSRASGCVMLLHMNEGTGTTTKDATQNGNNGTLVNGTTWVDGKFGKCLSFDGVDDYVNCGNTVSLNPTDAITVVAWVKYNSVSGLQEIVRKEGSYAFGIGWTARKFRFWIHNGAWVNSGDSITSVEVGKWYYVVGTYDKNGGTNNLKLYVNQNLEAQSTQTGQISTNTNFVGIGNYQGDMSEPHNGLIDDVRIYNRVLSPAEIKKIYYDGIGRHTNGGE
jgi:hypothetical protein